MTVPGAILQGRYQINEQLRQGGMGTVFKAKDLRLNRTVAVKACQFTDERLQKQFELEAQLLAVLRHPALPIVSDHFGEDNELFLVMDYIHGEDLGEVLQGRKEPFPPDDVLRWADQLLDALIFMHSQTPPIIHRDIKPQNLKLFRNQIFLLDFGLAKGSPEMKATMSKSIFGFTPHYASLEQIQGTGTDARSDLYSLGATLYHLLSAQMPVDALTRVEAVINGGPDPLPRLHDDNPQIPVGVSDVINQALALKREARPASAVEMRSLLREASRAATRGEGGGFPDIPPTIHDVMPGPEIVSSTSPNPDSVVTATAPKPDPAPVDSAPGQAQVNQSLSIPAKLDHAFYGGLGFGVVSAAIMIGSVSLRLVTFGMAVWLVSLSLTGAVVALFYVARSPVAVKPADVYKIGGLAGIVSAVVQWLLLVSAYFVNLLPVPLGSAQALVLFVCLQGLLGCISPISAFIAVRYLKGEKLTTASLSGRP